MIRMDTFISYTIKSILVGVGYSSEVWDEGGIEKAWWHTLSFFLSY
jgi:hypothetical protein